jgi:hypothetical protein
MKDDIAASPTKSFFVNMLTRDIDLQDAILDLLDNCVDGIVRSKKGNLSGEKPYAGFWAKITANPERFVIEDNCGGIPRKLAEDVAFRMGRLVGAKPEKLETVGIYGIGMKRAIFKLGKRAVVRSEHDGKAFEVTITPEWLQDESTWQLTSVDVKPTGNPGTTITVTELHDPIRRDFSKANTPFLTNLYGMIAENYSVIIGKGFDVELNTDSVKRVEFNLLVSKSNRGQDKKNSINPFVYKGKFGDVEFEVVVGFYRPPLTEEEIEGENEAPRADLSQAGWSVICNDRLVLRSDKTATTGWGTGGVPRFHNQFSSISGVVTLRSTDPAQLPLKTTKRGIETSSDVYFRLLDPMREGTKQFTDYTNKWKGKLDEVKPHFADAEPLPAATIPKAVSAGLKSIPKTSLPANAEADVFKPALPQPDKAESDKAKITFTRPVTEVRAVAKSLLDDEEAKPSQVGDACFQAALDAIPKSKKKKS